MKLFSGTPLSQFGDPAPVPPDEAGRDAAPGKTRREPSAAARVRATLRSEGLPAPTATDRLRTVVPPAPPTAPRVVAIPRLAQGGRWRVEAMRSLSEPLLLWFTRGQGRITVAGETRGYGVHNAIFIPAGTMHGFEVGSQTYGQALFFGHGATVTLPSTVQHFRVRDAASQAELSSALDSILRELESARPGSDRAARHHLGLIGVWLERQIGAPAPNAKRPAATQRLARDYATLLERDFHSGKGVAEYARALGVTPTHLSRVCNQSCGRSASDLLHDRVIFEARRLLSETRAPINEISKSLGFTSPAYFTRAFQHRTGKTPSAFRKQG